MGSKRGDKLVSEAKQKMQEVGKEIDGRSGERLTDAEIIKKLDEVIRLATAALTSEGKLSGASASQLGIIAGICIDKRRVMAGQPTDIRVDLLSVSDEELEKRIEELDAKRKARQNEKPAVQIQVTQEEETMGERPPKSRRQPRHWYDKDELDFKYDS